MRRRILLIVNLIMLTLTISAWWLSVWRATSIDYSSNKNYVCVYQCLGVIGFFGSNIGEVLPTTGWSFRHDLYENRNNVFEPYFSRMRWELLGFGFGDDDSVDISDLKVKIPHWFFAAWFAIYPLLRWWRWRKAAGVATEPDEEPTE